VDIPGNFLKIFIRIHQKRLVTPLVKMACPVMLPVIIGSIGNIEMPHEFLKIP
jgi:hypothetical protein